MQLSIDEAEAFLDETAETFPAALFDELNGGVNLLEDTVPDPDFPPGEMYILGEYRQPTFFYESVWCLFGFCAMLLIRNYKYLKIGQLTGFYLIWYGIIRFIIEAMRIDSLMLGPIKMAQLVSIVFVISGIIIFIKNIKNKKENLYNS